MVIKKCNCGKKFSVFDYRKDTAKYCSTKCLFVFRPYKERGYKNPNGSLAKMGKKNPRFGVHWTEEEKKNIGERSRKFHKDNPDAIKKMIRIGESNNKWKGDNVGYDALHDWVYRVLGSPMKCEHCCLIFSSNRNIHWANKSGDYKRNTKDWIRLCVKCHSKYDRHRRKI